MQVNELKESCEEVVSNKRAFEPGLPTKFDISGMTRRSVAASMRSEGWGRGDNSLQIHGVRSWMDAGKVRVATAGFDEATTNYVWHCLMFVQSCFFVTPNLGSNLSLDLGIVSSLPDLAMVYSIVDNIRQDSERAVESPQFLFAREIMVVMPGDGIQPRLRFLISGKNSMRISAWPTALPSKGDALLRHRFDTHPSARQLRRLVHPLSEARLAH